MEFWKKILLITCLLITLVSMFGCSEEGPMEKAGKQLDKTAQDVGDAAKKAFE